jgi:hypothetical protein
MQTAANARIASNSALTGLTYIDTLVSGATEQGLYQVNVDQKLLTSETIAELISDGYTVSEQYQDNNPNFIRYIISW